MKIGFILSIIVACLFPISCTPEDAQKDQILTGLMDANEYDVASKIPGRVIELLVREGDKVEAKQTLVRIESEEIMAKLDQVSAAIEGAQAQLAIAKKGARKEERFAVAKQLESARHQLDVTRKMYDRVSNLLVKGAVTQAQFDEAEFKYNIATDQLAQVQAKYTLVRKGARKEEINALESLVKQTKGAFAEVESYAKETTQISPIAGEVSKVILHLGELAATGYPIITIVDLKDQWAVFSVREDLLRNIKKGTEIKAQIPALGKTINMEIFNISAMGDFATWKATSEKDSFDLKSFEVKARPSEVLEGLRPGMSVRWLIP